MNDDSKKNPDDSSTLAGQIGAKAALDSAAAFQDKMLRDAGRIK